jgi:GGDEF domain-containing protein
MLNLLRRIRQRLRRQPAATGLTAIEYEAVSLIAYEGRSAYERAREQAEYCLRRGSEAGCRFWSDVALEVARSSILRRGDLALYAAKEEGRNRTKIDPKGTR